jgi:type IV secretion system protein VirB11
MSLAEHQAAETTLRWLLRPIQSKLLDDPKLTDLNINGVGEGLAFVDRGNGTEQITVPFTLRDLENIARYAAAFTGQHVSERDPICDTRLPNGERCNIILPPAVAEGKPAISIRKPKAVTHTPEQLKRDGVFDFTVDVSSDTIIRSDPVMDRLMARGEYGDATAYGVQIGLNIVFSGERGSGKTHDVRAYTHAIPMGTRIVTIEDMAELFNLPHANVVNLFYSKGGQSIANVNPAKLVEATKRMGEGRVLNQELRDDAAYSFMDVLDSGGKGMTTTHARSARETRTRIQHLIQRHDSGGNINEANLITMLERCIDLIAYCEYAGGKRRVKEILYVPHELKRKLAA